MTVVRAFIQSEERWRADAKRLSRSGYRGIRPDLLRDSEAHACRQAAATAALLGVPVGVVMFERQEQQP